MDVAAAFDFLVERPSSTQLALFAFIMISMWLTEHLISHLGADILAVFLLIAGLILVTGATLAGLLRFTGAGMLGTGRAVRRSTDSLSATLARRPVTAAAGGRGASTVAGAGGALADDLLPEPLLPPEPDTNELIVRATHVEAPPILDEEESDQLSFEPDGEPTVHAIDHDDAEDDSDLDEPEPGTAARRTSEPVEVDPEDLTPQGRYRGSVTDDPDFEASYKSSAPRKNLRGLGL